MTIFHKLLTWLNLALASVKAKEVVRELKKLGSIEEYFVTRQGIFYQAWVKVVFLEGQAILATGIDLDRDTASLKALSEAYERYFGITPMLPEQLICEPPDNTFPWKEFCKPGSTFSDIPMGVLGRKMGEPGDQKWIPQGLINFGKSIPGRDQFCTSSSGIAADSSSQIAAERGLLELIERHSVMVHWVTKDPPKQIARQLITKWAEAIIPEIKKFESQGYSVLFLDIMQDHAPPTVLCVIIRDDYPALSVGAACKPNWSEAIVKAFSEAWGYLTPLLKGTSVTPISDPTQVVRVADHPALYIDGSRNQEVNFLFQGEILLELRSSSYQGPKHWDAWSVNLTHPHDQIQVVRVVSTNCIPMTFGYGNECPLLMNRILEMNQLGYKEDIPMTPVFMG